MIQVAPALLASALLTLTVQAVDGPPPPASGPVDVDSLVLAEARTLAEQGSVVTGDGSPRELDPALDSFYHGAAEAPLWMERGRLAPVGRDVMDTLLASDLEGLHGEYGLPAIQALRERVGGGPGTAARVEVLLSQAFLEMARDLERGRTEPAVRGVDWRLERDAAPGAGVLEAVAGGRSPGRVLERLRPRVAFYDRLAAARVRYVQASADGGWDSLPTGPVVEAGDTAASLAPALRERFRRGADPRERALVAGARGPVYDSALVSAVRHFQRRHDLEIDGVYGPETAAELNVQPARRVAEIDLNLERFRWMPRTLGDRAVLVNVSGYEMAVLEEGEPVMEMGVIVGEPAWETAVFSDEMTHIIFNPYWHVPESIEAAETLPKLREDPGYLQATNMEVVPENRNFGEPVEPDFDWSEVDASSWPYDFRQRPGPENALGTMKFMFPNRYSIYLHDTPATQLFDRRFRAFSHGCIRVERPHDLARYLLRHETDRSPGVIPEILETRERTRVDLEEHVEVYVVYLTAWADEDGSVSFYPDVYDRDPSVRVVSQGDEGAS